MSPPDQAVKLEDLPGQVSNKLSYAHEEGDLDEASGLTHEELAFVRDFPDGKKKKVLWKVDVRLVPFLTLLYLFAYIDRANIGNAKIEGLVEDLGMTDDQYRICLSIFYVPYILFEIPSNHYLNKMKRPSIYIAAIVIAWGLVMTFSGLTQNFGGLLAIRLLLGATESGFFPGSILIISKWYLPNETQTRIAVFYTASALAGAFSGMLAAGIAQMDGIGGLEGWRWIFLLEGIVTVLLGVVTYFWLIDSPALSSGWLEPDEVRYLELRQRADPSRRAMARAKNEGTGSDTRKALISVLCDWQIWMHGIIYWSNTVPNNALKFTMPQIVRNMGFEATRAQLLTIPPYIIGAISAFVSSWFADRFSWRMPFIVGPQLIVIVAYSVLFAMAGDITNNVPACYFSICLACLGLYPINPCGNAWNLNNLAGPSKRAMGIAFMLCIGNVGGIIGGFIYIDSEKPKYPTGFGSSLGFVAAGVLACLLVEALYKYINTQRAKMTEEEVFAKYTPEELDAMGDRSPLYRYTL
ncbi:uncharacterized protein NECHADRAFT_94941 [Fusarium vanettenii 77-13-4]|uniref:Major facilitator superfamily (MFS) profile domain-containing protein n=1 Tax=Fusarium vanettenii (strain ATCC MYA-4622 / CBS 123669 / FGSC 9596 / NRRL 45880 / 77-13-4) TaxID=660122 RepID=C7YXM7_FUSV7|nr:uncharacterized protein NECHADRAFT_94941 [Fusarium vanettenii 77-13-4]EEU43615.1 hypothetical protein NECHADRAFT_94941 [Fusarium vanettenii 77-13-4]